MCGIVGIVHNSKKNYKSLIKSIIKSQHHRGPDQNGIQEEENVVFGHNRLSIVDLLNGHQPMKSSTGKTLITFNGEIYTHKELRKKINYPFKTNCDTEVVLALYEKYNLGMFNFLNGMFAFAIWDIDRRRLIIARDRFGEKPLYFANGLNGEFIFASEISSIAKSGIVSTNISSKGLGNYLSNLYTGPEQTIYENIISLKPGHYLVFEDEKLSIQRYYHFNKTIEISKNEASAVFVEKFEKSIKRQMEADVDVGAFLSGGIDSSSIVSIAKKYRENLTTFSFGFSGGKNEANYAREIAKKYNTNHHEINEVGQNIGELILKMGEIYDEPFADSSNIPTYLISKYASQYVKVVLSGDGADELLAGYDWWYQTIPGIMEKKSTSKEITYRLLSKFFSAKFQKKANFYYGARKYRYPIDAYLNRHQYFNNLEINKLLSLTHENLATLDFELDQTGNDVLKADISNYLNGDILYKTDKASMANSLEVRSPFLDAEFADFLISLPFSLKYDNKESKSILRYSCGHLLTKSILTRKKQGFGSPISHWLKRGDVKELSSYYFSKNRKIFDHVSYDYAKKYFINNKYQKWSLLNLSVWFEKHV